MNDHVECSKNNLHISKGLSLHDKQWILTLFGTGVGAGVLFLPINAGLGGIWPLLIMTIIVGPMAILSHRMLLRFCLSSNNNSGDITDTVTEHFGPKSGKLISFGYFAAIYPILMIYGIGMTNTISSLLVNQLGFEILPHRSILSLISVAMMVGIIACGQKAVLRVTSVMFIPLLIILIGTSIYLAPQWNVAQQFSVIPTLGGTAKTLFLTIPVLVFAYNISPIISSYGQDYRKRHGINAEKIAGRNLKISFVLLLLCTLSFVYSCVLTLSPEELLQAKQANVSILSYLAERTTNSVFGWLAQIFAMLAICSSFFGHYMGCHEGLRGFILSASSNSEKVQGSKSLDHKIMLFITLTVWAVAYIDLSVIGMIEALVAPIIASILFIMPVYATYKVPAMYKYRSASNYFVVIMGVLGIAGFIVSQLI